MSYLHVTKNGMKKTFWIEDGKSGLLDRYVNLDTGEMHRTIGRQIAGKPINPNGALGKKIMATARSFEKQTIQTKNNSIPDLDWICLAITLGIIGLFFALGSILK